MSPSSGDRCRGPGATGIVLLEPGDPLKHGVASPAGRARTPVPGPDSRPRPRLSLRSARPPPPPRPTRAPGSGPCAGADCREADPRGAPRAAFWPPQPFRTGAAATVSAARARPSRVWTGGFGVGWSCFRVERAGRALQPRANIRLAEKLQKAESPGKRVAGSLL